MLSGHRLKRRKLREREKRNRETGEQGVSLHVAARVCVRACVQGRERWTERGEERRRWRGVHAMRERDGLPLKTEEV